MLAKRKGYRVERNIRKEFEKNRWKVIRAGASLGEADLVCFKNRKCLFLQIKSTRKKKFYYYGFLGKTYEGFPFYLIVDFGYGRVRIIRPQKTVEIDNGESLVKFLLKSSK